MTRPCLCGLAGRPRRLFGFTAREAAGGAPSFRTVLVDLGGIGLPPTFTRGTSVPRVGRIQGGRSPPPRRLPLLAAGGELLLQLLDPLRQRVALGGDRGDLLLA